MHATRAYLAGLGTTGLLVMAALAILITASALLAFDGWPGEAAANGSTPVLIDPGREVTPGTGPAAVAAEAGDVADDVAFATGPGEDGGDGGADAGVGGGPRDETPGDRGPDDSAPDAPADPSPPAGGGGTTPPARVSPTDGLADGAQSVTDFLGAGAVSGVSPELGLLLTNTGQALTDLVRALDGTPPPPRP